MVQSFSLVYILVYLGFRVLGGDYKFCEKGFGFVIEEVDGYYFM